MNKIGDLIGKYLVFIVPIVLLTLMSVWIWQSVACRSWPSVLGEVVKPDIKSSTTSSGGLSYSPQVEYEYEVEGKKYSASRISYIPIIGDKASTRCIQEFRKNAQVRVFYNPNKPQQSVLEPGFRFRFILGLMLFFVFAFVALIVVVTISQRRSEKTSNKK